MTDEQYPIFVATYPHEGEQRTAYFSARDFVEATHTLTKSYFKDDILSKGYSVSLVDTGLTTDRLGRFNNDLVEILTN
ncbi:MAG: hypothetical protein Q8Q35_00815 [Nanoarchaeota archaeon]|nr:hypothetical protein [Nanoarchaeota archaeon]